MLQRQVHIEHAVGSSADRRHEATVTAKVWLCRMFVIAVFLPATMFGVSAYFRTSIEDEVRAQVRRYAFEAFPQWAQTEHEHACPASIETLAAVIGDRSAEDLWGTTLDIYCGPAARVVVRSAGPDRSFDTADDISSHD